MLRIVIDCRLASHEEIRHILSTQLKSENITQDKVKLEIKQLRGVEPSILIALISSTGLVLTTLIGCVMKLALSKNAQKIVIQGKDGERVEVPADTSENKLDSYIRKAQEISINRITIE